VDRRLSLALLAAQAAAFWPVWAWYARRLADPSDEPWGALALATLVALSLAGPNAVDRPRGVAAAAGLTAAYAAAFPLVPPLARLLLALAACAATLATLTGGRALHPSRLALAALATPLVPTLQFVAGYPLRVAAGELAALMLRATGLPVAREGVLLALGDVLVQIDAPCSGVRMLWAGLFLAAIVSWRLRAAAAAACLAAAVAAVVLANALRSAALFLPEAGLLRVPAFAHEAVGLVAFALAAALVAVVARRLAEPACAG
jgi:exosortase/archaeosortase family protein